MGVDSPRSLSRKKPGAGPSISLSATTMKGKPKAIATVTLPLIGARVALPVELLRNTRFTTKALCAFVLKLRLGFSLSLGVPRAIP